jgi:hypothetical protein
MRRLKISVVFGCVGLLVAASSCKQKPQTFETTVELARTEVVSTAAGRWVDVELEYSDCPGEQSEIFQADSAFADCITKHKPGEKLKASIVWSQEADGHYDSEVESIGECHRKRDALDERSYEVVHECKDLVVNGVNVGFRCVRKPSPELLAKCPWFKRT